MAKKSSKKTIIDNSDLAEIAEMFSMVMESNGITLDELMNAMSMMNGDTIQDMYNMMYDYEKPDYSKMVQPLHQAIMPIIEHEGVGGISEALRESLQILKNIDHAEASKALINSLYYILANQERLEEDGHTNLSLFAILHMMIELDVKGSTPAIIELLSQDGNFYEFFFGAFEEDMSFAISKLCKDGLKELEEYMYATGRIPGTKCIVADGVIHMALLDPMIRLAVISWFARVLTRYADIVVYETNIDHITKSLAQLNAKELKPLIEHLYAIKDVPFIEVSNKTELKRLLSNGTDERRIETESLAEIIKTVENRFLEEEEEEWDEEDNWDEDLDIPPYINRKPTRYEGRVLVSENEDGQLYRLEISLVDSPIEVTRELIVPSNIRLSWLSKVLKITMGWEDYHLDQFIKGREYYGTVDDEWSDCEDYEEYALNDLLSRKSSKILWEYDFGDSWMHSIKLIEKIKCKGKPIIEASKAVNACPPEDCGGVDGYSEMLQALKDENDPEHESWAQWIDEDFDPYYVSLPLINSDLKSISRHL